MCCCMPVMVQKVTPVDYVQLPPSCKLVPLAPAAVHKRTGDDPAAVPHWAAAVLGD